jgi:diguanylate cyclase (GGDEF)-like protein
MNLAGYSLRDILYAVDDTVVARAESGRGRRVVLKYQRSEHPAPELHARWQHEFAVLQSIRSEWVIRALGLETADNGLVLVLEDFGTCNLAQLIERERLEMSERLAFAIQLTEAVSAVHTHGLIHCDISSKNVLIDVPTLRLKLCDFGLSTRLDREQKSAEDMSLRGTLEYMSPEQTGRTSLDVDYRSDFYSLGATLYELFSGRTPFQSGDPMSLLHAQIAIMPPPLHEIDPAIPETVSGIVQKLLAKSPDERYQSSYGLLGDLNTCAQQWHRYRRIERFTLAGTDVPERLCISHRIYGREAESAAILEAFERVGEGQPALALVSGSPGIGKTALVGQLHRPIVARRGYFLRGKFDQFSRNQPYSALIEAFGVLLRQLLAEGEQRRQYWKSELSAALGENAGAIAPLLPDLKLLIGEPPPLMPLPPAENENRFQIAFRQFVQALSTKAHPLTLFLDDLQWADAPTLKLIDHLVSSEAELCLLIIGAYRDNEVDAAHPLQVLIESLDARQGRLHRLQLRPLDFDEVSRLIADTLHAGIEEVAELAALCQQKTLGNPFFLGQFLGSLKEHGDLHYGRSVGAWRWDVERIRARGMTDNVVELMLERLRTLPPETQRLLSLAAHLGGSFDMRLLMALDAADAVTTAARLWPALQAGLVLPLDEHYKFDHDAQQLQAARYRFLHDRVQQAAYELTPAQERLLLALQSGRRLLAATDEQSLDARLFTILEQLNPVLDLIESEQERARLLELNLRGGLRAKAASAHAAAVGLLRQARDLLPAGAWQSQPARTLLIHKELAEAEYLAGNFEQAEQLYPQAIAAAADAAGKVTLCLVQADQYAIQGRFEDAMRVQLQALKLLGRDFPASEEDAGALFHSEFETTERMLAQRSHYELLQAAEATAPEVLLEMRICFALSYSTYQTGRGLSFVVNACRLVQATLKHGQSDLSCIGYVAYVTAMSAMRRPYPQCYAMGKLALTLAEQRENKYFRLTVYQYFSAFYQHWMEPLANSFAYLEKGIELGQTGINPLSAGFAALLNAVNKLVQGVPLDQLELECEAGLKFLVSSRQPNTEAMLRHGVLQPVLALRGKTRHALSFDTAQCSSEAFFAGDFDTPSIPLALYSAAMIRHAYLFDEAPLWRRFSPKLAMIGQALPDGPCWVDACFYSALGLLRFECGEHSDPADALAQGRAALDRFEDWAQHCGGDFQHRHLLLAAEMARVEGDDRAAMDLYARAIDAAKAADYPAGEALANELYALFWMAQGQPQLSSNFMREAHFHYQRWGAVAKCAALEQRWPQIQFRAARRGFGGSMRTATLRNISEQVGLLDLHSLLKASQLLAKEIHLDSLLEKMLEVLLENAGADRAAIVLEEEDRLIVEAVGGLDSSRRIVCERVDRRLQDYSDECGPLLPRGLIEQVRLARATLVLDNPQDDARFSASVYLRQRRPKSVMCVPVVSQGRLSAVLYLENNQLEGAFTAKQQVTLELLGAQAAISLVNARLYANLERKVAQRTEELRQMTLRDGLTGIANRRYFDERLGIEWRRGLRSGRPLSFLLVDIDYFKQFNDHYGHVEGDACIRAVAQTLQRLAARPGDTVARYGGEEFAILLPETDAAAATRVAESCMRALAELAIPHAHSDAGSHLSISIGICTLSVDESGQPEDLVSQADRALYEAKRSGRARYCHFQPAQVSS